MDFDRIYATRYTNNQGFFTLSQKIVILITLVVFIALLPSAMFTTNRVAQVIYDRVSINAASINTILCYSPEIRKGLQSYYSENIETNNEIMANFVNEVDNSDEASVAVYDKDRKLRVLYNPSGIKDFSASAHELVDKYADYDDVNWQENYQIPNKAFGYVKNNDGILVGYVVTGYSDDILNNSAIDSILFLLFMTMCGLLVGIFGAVYLAGKVKKILFGLEPEAIAAMLEERNIMLDSVREGIMTMDSDGTISMLNVEAKVLLQQAKVKDGNKLVGKNVFDILGENTIFQHTLENGKIFTDASIKLGDTVFIMTCVPLQVDEEAIGAVITFRKKSVVEEMANQLTGFKNYATALRAQTHEFMNKMHVIMGLIDMQAYDELKQFTKEIAYNRQSEVSYIVTRLKDITLSGFVLGKISRSRELDIDFTLSEESEIHTSLEVPSVHDLVLIIGNLLDNAFDILKDFEGERIVSLSVLDFDKELVIVVEDSGPGMDVKLRQIFLILVILVKVRAMVMVSIW